MHKQNYNELKKSGILKWKEKGYTGKGVTILVLDDEGSKYKWFDDNIIQLFDNHEDDGHGSNVTQVIREGSASSKIIMTNFFGEKTNREEIIAYIKQHKDEIDIINVSNSTTTFDFNEFKSLGIPIVCSSGNSGTVDGVDHPADLEFTIAIGAFNEATETIASYSQGGVDLDCVIFTNIFVYNQTKTRDFLFPGTSGASPWAVAMLSLVLGYLKDNNYKKPTSKQLKDFIHDSCIDLENEGFDLKSGWGRFVLKDIDKINFDKYFVKGDDDLEIKMTIGSKKYYIDGVAKTMDTEPIIDENDRTLVPVRFIGEALGCKVEWDEDTKTVTLISGDN